MSNKPQPAQRQHPAVQIAQAVSAIITVPVTVIGGIVIAAIVMAFTAAFAIGAGVIIAIGAILFFTLFLPAEWLLRQFRPCFLCRRRWRKHRKDCAMRHRYHSS